MRKRMLTAALAAVMVLATSMTAFAGQWQQDGANWRWQNDDGTYTVNTWQWIDGDNDGTAECYYFDASGTMLADTTTPDGYRVNTNGAWVLSGGAWMPSDVIQIKRVGDGTAIAVGTGAAAGPAKTTEDAAVKNDTGTIGELLPGNPAVANGSFDVAAYGYENHISKLLFDVPFMSREKIAELLGGERKVKIYTTGAYTIWYNGISEHDLYVTFDPDGSCLLYMEPEMALESYTNLNNAFDEIASAGGYTKKEYTITGTDQIKQYMDSDSFELWTDRNGKTLLFEANTNYVVSYIVSFPGAIQKQ